MVDEEIDNIIERTERMLKASYAGYKQFQEKEGDEKMIGLFNAASSGRSVTLVLQNLRGKADGFDDWYDDRKETLKNDEVCNHMKDVRNRVLKEGDAGTRRHIDFGDGMDIGRLQRSIPSWADGVFVGDQFGGSGFVVENPDGSENKFYYDFPTEPWEVGLHFPELEEKRSIHATVEDDVGYYVKILAELVRDAKNEFRS